MAAGEEKEEGLAGGGGGGGQALGAEFRASCAFSLSLLPPCLPPFFSFLFLPFPPPFIRRQRSAPKRLPGGLLWQQVARETAGMSCARED